MAMEAVQTLRGIDDVEDRRVVAEEMTGCETGGG